ncbi:MAG: 2-amino-4-hydroxy-6-hydroxymethyldihydropteridine diphosphokinase [Succinivibrio sp.]|nr:2-amino-4-hydroxy-6-hydroxymethyldihydropteridine diphosphokinase [Succinivibrio sp.]
MGTLVYLGVGSNLNRENALRFAKARLEGVLTKLRCSSIWISHAVRAAEPDYFNMVMEGQTEQSIEELYAQLQDIERQAGEEPMFNHGTNFGMKRRLDIDILLFGQLVTTAPCKVPRHDIQDYPFVLCPLCELAPELLHPLLKIPVGDLWKEMEPRLPEQMQVKRTEIDWSVEAPAWRAGD